MTNVWPNAFGCPIDIGRPESRQLDSYVRKFAQFADAIDPSFGVTDRSIRRAAGMIQEKLDIWNFPNEFHGGLHLSRKNLQIKGKPPRS